MREELIDLIEKFIEICDSLYVEGKIDKKMYGTLTKNKFDFLRKLKKVG